MLKQNLRNSYVFEWGSNILNLALKFPSSLALPSCNLQKYDDFLPKSAWLPLYLGKKVPEYLSTWRRSAWIHKKYTLPRSFPTFRNTIILGNELPDNLTFMFRGFYIHVFGNTVCPLHSLFHVMCWLFNKFVILKVSSYFCSLASW